MIEKVTRFILFIICLAFTIYFIYYESALLSATWSVYTTYQAIKFVDLIFKSEEYRMSKKVHEADCYGCLRFNIHNCMGEECEGEKHIFCDKSLKSHDKQIKNEILSDIEEIILEIMYCNNKEIGKYVKVAELRERLEELRAESEE